MLIEVQRSAALPLFSRWMRETLLGQSRWFPWFDVGSRTEQALTLLRMLHYPWLAHCPTSEGGRPGRFDDRLKAPSLLSTHLVPQQFGAAQSRFPPCW